jgi:4,5-dihydroxyphthalate decarboxylase
MTSQISPGLEPFERRPAAHLKVLLGDYPHTRAVLSRDIRSDWLALDFVEAKPLNTAFKQMVRSCEFDVSELSLATFLQAKDAGKPLVLLPYVVMSRYQHPYLLYDSGRGPLSPQDLPRKRIGCRLFTANTAVWIRYILAKDYGVPLEKIEWIAFQDPHVAEFSDPPNVRKAPPGSDLVGLLFSGAADAIVMDPIPADPRIKPVIPDPEGAARSWKERYGAIQINHMVVATEEICSSQPDAVMEFWRMLMAARPSKNGTSVAGYETLRHDIELAIDCVFSQGLISRRFRPEELFTGLTAGLAP